MSCELATLREVLSAAGHAPETLGSPGGGAVLVLPYGGRILGLFDDEHDANFLWTSPLLQTIDGARDLFRSVGWHNTGGDRTWLAPEIDFFFPSFPDASVYHQQRALDPGAYRVTHRGAAIELAAEMTLRVSRGGELRLRVTKRVTLAPNPLAAHPQTPAALRTAFAGYALRTELEILGGSDPLPQVALWSLLQLPPEGEMVVPTRKQSEPIHFMGEISPKDLRTDDRRLSYRMGAPGEHKIGLRPAELVGRAGYCHVHEGLHALVVREFAVDADGSYIDAPVTRPEATGAAFQACSINSCALGQFSELEYHVPAIGGPRGPRRCVDNSRVWAYHGDREAIAWAQQALRIADPLPKAAAPRRTGSAR